MFDQREGLKSDGVCRPVLEPHGGEEANGISRGSMVRARSRNERVIAGEAPEDERWIDRCAD